MSRLIDADELKASLGEPPENWTSSPEEIQALNDFYSFQDLIDAQPTAQPEPSQVARDIATIIENEMDMRVILDNTAPHWIPCSDRLPDDLAEVNVTWVNHDPEPYYDFVKDKPATASAVYYKGKWYWYSSVCADILAEYGNNDADEVDVAIEILAWMPLPEPYKER